MSRFFSLSRQAPLQRIAPPGEDHPADQPGADIVDEAGGLAAFMGWHGPTITDSGGTITKAEWLKEIGR